ncbi:Isoaspartyl peptidase precursor [Clavibacter michiganensis]|uniref:Isoaspartyl peptidase n=1 Tax=Clavibacter michiganensis TaxID=28447 RepID=A0A251Y326_9MICO|nr:isoaspartyl peptidase/L-asparaginase [Clavibacter michiganensis]OUE18665.1 Isoaspartyl peptidase precursor [Clavibacter michiganensis]
MGLAEESSQAPRPTRSWSVPPGPDGTALALHGGAGGRILELSREEAAAFDAGLRRAHDAGSTVLARGGSALDAVCAAVERLEDDPLFNAGRGAALTADGHAELDAAVMTGAGRAGAVAVSRHARNPVRAARAVLEETDHVLLVDPSAELIAGWGLATADPAYFVTEARQRQLARVRADLLQGARHGTVGAVARDRTGALAAATSTGGMVNQTIGRVGDTPVIGAGTYARDGVAAVSCTGEGESFLRGVVSHDIAARVRHLGSPLEEAVLATVEAELTARGASGGLVAVGGDGTLVIAHNSPTLFAAFPRDGRLVVLT